MGSTLLVRASDEGNNATYPMHTPSLSIWNLFRPGGYMPTPAHAPKGSWMVQTSYSWVNTWNFNKDYYLIDTEWHHISASLSYMVNQDLEVGMQIPMLGRTGGMADGFIEGFHRTFDFGSVHREDYPRNRSLIEIKQNGERATYWEGDEWGLSDVSLFTAWTVTQGGPYRPGITVGALVTFPTGDETHLLGSGELTYLLSILLTKQIADSPWWLFLGTSVSYSDNREMLGIATRQTQFGGLGGIEFRWNDRLSVIVQSLSLSPIADDFEEFSRPTSEVNLGVRLREVWGGDWDLSLQENVVYYNNSPDIGLHFSYRRRL